MSSQGGESPFGEVTRKNTVDRVTVMQIQVPAFSPPPRQCPSSSSVRFSREQGLVGQAPLPGLDRESPLPMEKQRFSKPVSAVPPRDDGWNPAVWPQVSRSFPHHSQPCILCPHLWRSLYFCRQTPHPTPSYPTLI